MLIPFSCDLLHLSLVLDMVWAAFFVRGRRGFAFVQQWQPCTRGWGLRGIRAEEWTSVKAVVLMATTCTKSLGCHWEVEVGEASSRKEVMRAELVRRTVFQGERWFVSNQRFLVGKSRETFVWLGNFI